MPLSVYLGRVVADGDPLWTPHDRYVAEAWIAYRESLHTCGVPVDVAFDRDQSIVVTPDGQLAERWSGEIQECFPCAATDRTARKWREAGQSPGVEANNDGMIPVLHDRLGRPGHTLHTPTPS